MRTVCLLSACVSGKPPELFLYDVTSSYLEGEHNELADWGYNRDKKQIVLGLLCDEKGEPVSTEVFQGNTGDLSTFESQIKKVSMRFGCVRVTFVGDRGMIKGGQIEVSLIFIKVSSLVLSGSVLVQSTTTKRIWLNTS